MPLSTGTTNKSREQNVKTEIAAGRPPKQAAAIAYATQRRNVAKKAHSADSMGRVQDALRNFVSAFKK